MKQGSSDNKTTTTTKKSNKTYKDLDKLNLLYLGLLEFNLRHKEVSYYLR